MYRQKTTFKLSFFTIVLIVAGCNNSGSFPTDNKKIKCAPKANVKFYKKYENRLDNGAILVINDSDCYIQHSTNGKFVKYKYATISTTIKDTIIDNKIKGLKYDGIFYYFVDSSFIDITKALILDTVSLTNFNLEAVFTLDFNRNKLHLIHYYFRDGKSDSLNFADIDNSYIIGLNYCWQLIEKNKLTSEKDPTNILWVLTKDKNIRTYTFSNTIPHLNYDPKKDLYFDLFKAFLMHPIL